MPLRLRSSNDVERLRARAERAREELWIACRDGDLNACRILGELGEPCAPKHWADIDNTTTHEET